MTGKQKARCRNYLQKLRTFPMYNEWEYLCDYVLKLLAAPGKNEKLWIHVADRANLLMKEHEMAKELEPTRPRLYSDVLAICASISLAALSQVDSEVQTVLDAFPGFLARDQTKQAVTKVRLYGIRYKTSARWTKQTLSESSHFQHQRVSSPLGQVRLQNW